MYSRMKLVSVVATALLLKCSSATVEAATADCCTNFDERCYNSSSPANNMHACDACRRGPCADECEIDSASASCETCCVAYPEHEISWECEVPKVECQREGYGLGNYSAHTLSNPLQCAPNGDDEGFRFDILGLGTEATATDCIDACENVGVAGCCQFREVVSDDGKEPTVSQCTFISVRGETVDAIRSQVNGTIPVELQARRRLDDTVSGTFIRATPCSRVVEEPTEPPSSETEAPSSSAAAASKLNVFDTKTQLVALVVMCCFLALQM